MNRRSGMKSETQRIVVRRKRRLAEDKPTSGSWKIAYADYMTAMMAFFLVMWLLSLVPQSDLEAIAEYFRMPLMEAVRGGGSVGEFSGTPIPSSSPAIIPHPIPARGDSLSPGDARDKGRLESLRSDLDSLIETDPVLEEYRPQLLLDMTPDGLRVQIIDQQNRPMFATGSAQMQPELSIVLRALAPFFNRLPNKITLAGHTDAVQYATGEREYSNWELSADRANAARKELVAGGLDEAKVKQVLGLSSSVSLVKDNPNAAVNRRISIVVLSERAERRIDEQAHAGDSAIQLEQILGEGSSPHISQPAWLDSPNESGLPQP